MNCEGACKEHKGDVVSVVVKDKKTGHDWGKFAYCQAAIAADRSSGLQVLYTEVYCSNCGGTFHKLRESGYSHCKDHRKEAKE